jgi:hypothetical protein
MRATLMKTGKGEDRLLLEFETDAERKLFAATRSQLVPVLRPCVSMYEGGCFLVAQTFSFEAQPRDEEDFDVL